MRFATNIILPLFLVVFNLNSYAQVEFLNYSKSNGLTSNTILTTMVDSKGVVWVGTANGVCAYTSSGWVKIKSISDNNRYSKFIGRVSIIYEAINGDIWICGEKGIFVFNGEYWTYFDDNENKGFEIANIFEDRRGWVWVMYEKYQSLKDVSVLGFSMVEGILQMYNGERWHKFVGEIGGSAAIAIGDKKQYFTSHIQDDAGNLWITSLDGLYRFDGYSWTEYDNQDLPSDICNEVIQNNNGDIWVATRNGVAFKDKETWIDFKKQKGIKGLDAVHFYEDHLNRLWILSRKDDRFKSICMYDGEKWKPFFKEKVKIKGDIDNLVTDDSLVVVYSDKGVAAYVNGKWKDLLQDSKIKDTQLGNFFIFSRNRMFFTGRKGLYLISDGSISKVYEPSEDWKVNSIIKQGNVLVMGTDRSGIFVYEDGVVKNYTSDDGLPESNIKYIFNDKLNNLWIVTRSGISLLVK